VAVLLALGAAPSPVEGSGVAGVLAHTDSPSVPAGAYITVNFTEGNLTLGAEWTVAVGNSSWSSTASYLTISEPNGSYTYRANATVSTNQSPWQWAAQGAFQVHGVPVAVNVRWESFSPVRALPAAGTSAAPGASTGGTLLVEVLVVVILAVVAVVAAVARFRPAPPKPPIRPGLDTAEGAVENRESLRPASAPSTVDDPLRHML
jgi:hypothetical protein